MAASFILQTLEASRHEFLQPSTQLHVESLNLVKQYLDPVALSVGALQLERVKNLRQNRKRKRRIDDEPEPEVLRLKNLAVQGFSAQQVWEQVLRITNAAEAETREFLVDQDQDGENSTESDQDNSSPDSDHQSDDDEEEVEADETDKDTDLTGPLSDAEEEFDNEGEDENDDEDEDEEKKYSVKFSTKPSKDKFGLNDNSFSIDEFNRRTEMLERQDAQGNPDADAASDEEDVDWDADPMSVPIPDEIQSGDNDSEDDGPGFGNMDLMVPEGASDAEGDDDDDMDLAEVEQLTENLMYNEFFGQPKKKRSSKGFEGRKAKLVDTTDGQNPQNDNVEQEMKRAMAVAQHDLFSDESESEEPTAKKPISSSSHQRAQASIVTQIRELEALNLSERPWVLTGETKAKDRPTNAILGEDLDFESAGKPMPVITAEMSEDTVQLIKRRIMARDFQEVRRRRPDEELAASTRRGRLTEDPFDMSLKRERKGLGEMYEEEHVKQIDAGYVDRKTEALNKEYAEIENLWKETVAQLDSLASFRFRPKETEMSITVRSDAPAMTLEDARPSGAGGEVGYMNQLAPQEVYKTGDKREQGKVTLKNGAVMDRGELSQDNRKRLRRREKERQKKAQAQQPQVQASGQSQGNRQQGGKKSKPHQEQKRVAQELKLSGVKVIGSKGELQSVEGREIKKAPKIVGSSFKL